MFLFLALTAMEILFLFYHSELVEEQNKKRLKCMAGNSFKLFIKIRKSDG
jgi:hypothetical protein